MFKTPTQAVNFLKTVLQLGVLATAISFFADGKTVEGSLLFALTVLLRIEANTAKRD